jgi:hypothetical protein
MDNAGKLIKPGQKISWDQHVHAAGEAVKAGSELGIWLYPKGQEPKKRSYLIGFTGLKNGQAALDIPPNSIAYTEGVTVLKENTIITNFQPHFHLRGKAMQVEAIFPDGHTQVISYVSDFNFNWMTNYIFADDAAPAFPKNTIIHVTAYYDNTKGNKSNPDARLLAGSERKSTAPDRAANDLAERRHDRSFATPTSKVLLVVFRATQTSRVEEVHRVQLPALLLKE